MFGTDPRGKACQNRSGLASRLLLTVGVGHVRDRGGWGPWRRPILGSTRHSRRTGPVARGGAVSLEGVTAVQVTVLIEVIVDRGVDGGEL